MAVVIITMLVVIADQLTKFIVNSNMAFQQSVTVIPGILDFTYIRNDGAAWGMLDDKRWVFLILSTVAIAVIVFILAKYRESHFMMKLPLALILGGGIGNMIDRILYTEELLDGSVKMFGEGYRLFDGVVVDFIEATFIDFPVFNIADCAVTVGTILLFIYIIFIDSKLEKAKKLAAEKEKADSADGDANEQ